MITIQNKQFQLYIPASDIHQNVQRIAQEIDRDFAGQSPVFLVILNGAFMFASDLLKAIQIDGEVSFIKVASYANGQSTGQLKTILGLAVDITNKPVIIIEDIVDTGFTLQQLIQQLKQQQPKSIKVATFLQKPTALQYPIHCDYVGISITNRFVIGYGLDYNGYGRTYPDIYQLAQS